MSCHLIADDEELNRMVIRILLEKNGYETFEVNNGQDVITKVEAAKDKYSIIWLDLEMPELDGIQCAKKLKNDLEYKGIVIGITGHVDSESIKYCLDAGMDGVIAKPISEESLMEKINLLTK